MENTGHELGQVRRTRAARPRTGSTEQHGRRSGREIDTRRRRRSDGFGQTLYERTRRRRGNGDRPVRMVERAGRRRTGGIHSRRDARNSRYRTRRRVRAGNHRGVGAATDNLSADRVGVRSAATDMGGKTDGLDPGPRTIGDLERAALVARVRTRAAGPGGAESEPQRVVQRAVANVRLDRRSPSAATGVNAMKPV